MTKEELVLAGLAAGKGASHSPVQVQKLFFLIDKKVPKKLGGPFFTFRPYDYGPFDRSVYDVLETLAENGQVEILGERDAPWRKYQLTENGRMQGDGILQKLSDSTREYLVDLSQWVRCRSFTELVSAIYNAYPDMKKRSVFQG